MRSGGNDNAEGIYLTHQLIDAFKTACLMLLGDAIAPLVINIINTHQFRLGDLRINGRMQIPQVSDSDDANSQSIQMNSPSR